jgi:hypothetical protein
VNIMVCHGRLSFRAKAWNTGADMPMTSPNRRIKKPLPQANNPSPGGLGGLFTAFFFHRFRRKGQPRQAVC